MAIIYLRNFPESLKKAVKSVAGRKGQTMLDFLISLARENKEIVKEEKYIISQERKERREKKKMKK